VDGNRYFCPPKQAPEKDSFLGGGKLSSYDSH